MTNGTGRRSAWRSLILAALLGILLFFLLTEHRAHFFGILPWLLLAACPLLHLFMHRSHGGRGAGPAHDAEKGKPR